MNKEDNEISTNQKRKSDMSVKLIHSPEKYTIEWNNGIKFILTRDDLLNQETNAIVNAANRELWLGAGVAGMIRSNAGEEINEECMKIIKERGKSLETGEVVYTSKGKLTNNNLKYIFHSAGPFYRGGQNGEEEQLFNSFYNSFLLAEKLKLNSIAFPPISSGRFAYPTANVADVFYRALDKFITENSEGSNSLKEIRMVIIDFPTYFVFAEEHNRILKYLKEKYQNMIIKVDPDFSNLIDVVIKEKQPDKVSEQTSHKIENLNKEFEMLTKNNINKDL